MTTPIVPNFPVVYVAGPYRASSECSLYNNIEEARNAAQDVWAMGAVALCPHLNTAFFGGVVPDDQFLDGDLVLISRCDAVLLLPTWRNSEGATAERWFAFGNDIPVFEEQELLAKWITDFLERTAP